MELQKYGEFYLNSESITEIEVINGTANIFLADGRVRQVLSTDIQDLIKKHNIQEKERTSGEVSTGGSEPWSFN